jgi:hypothetical protein
VSLFPYPHPDSCRDPLVLIDAVVPLEPARIWAYADIQANLALTSQRYTEEHERCTRYETLWRDAQDREAKGLFEIAQLLDEISQLRAKR